MDSPGASGRDVGEVSLGNVGDLAGCGGWPRWFGIRATENRIRSARSRRASSTEEIGQCRRREGALLSSSLLTREGEGDCREA